MTKPSNKTPGGPQSSGTRDTSSNVVRLQTKGPEISDGQRALWTFLGATLVAPFLAAVVIFLASLLFGFVLGRGPSSLLALDPAGKLAWSATKAVETYVWCAIPAGISGAIAAGVVYATGKLHWLAAASIAAIVASAVAAFSGGMLATHITPIAFIAATVAIVLQLLLRRARILT